MSLLAITGLRTFFRVGRRDLRVVDGVSFTVEAGETVGVVGESGCGKSVMSLSILGLVPSPGRIVEGSVCFDGKDLAKLGTAELRAVRGRRIAMIFQDPMSSLNPVYSIGEQITEAIQLHQDVDDDEAEGIAVRWLSEVGIPRPEEMLDTFPHELSGGMKQRVMIAMALCCDPALLVADEPTTALDVTIQAQILDLLRDLCARRGLAVLLVTHDLGVVAETCARVVVMYAGKVVETATTEELFRAPAHPYTRGLLGALPGLVPPGSKLQEIPGSVPAPADFPDGCRFRARCPTWRERQDPACETEPPERTIREGHRAWCHFPERA